MATPEEEKALREAIKKLAQEQSQIENDRLNLSMTLVETLKETLGITSQRGEFDRSLLSVNREITRSLLNQKEGLREISDIEKQILKNNDIAAKAKKLQESLTNSIGDGLSKEFKQTERILARRQRIDEVLQSEIDKLNAGQAVDQSKVDRLKEMAQVADEQLATTIRNLSVSEQQLIVTKQNEKALQKANQERQKELDLANQIQNAEGLTGKAVGTIGKLLGLNSDTQNKIKQDAKERLQALQDEGKLMDGYQGKVQGLKAYAKSFGTNLLSAVTDPAAIFAAMGQALLRNSQLTNQFQSELGVGYNNARAMRQQLANAADTSGDLFINSEKLQKSFFALKDTTGVFFDLSSQSAETFTNLTERIGLAGQEAGNLTMLMRLQGKETEANLGNLYDTTGAMLQTSKTTASVKDILGDVAKSSKGLQASLAANPQALAKAAIAARELGATLADMEKVQGALLDFEQSIGAELEAELLTGKQLNLEKARLAALNNDMAALGEELKKQNVDLASFGKMNVKQQEAMAKAMGMQRGELGDMLLKQEMQNKSLDEIRSTMGEQAYEQAKALSAQDKFNAATAKLKDLFANVMTAFTPIIDAVAMIVEPIAWVAKWIGKLNEATGGWSNKLLGVAIIAKMLGKNLFSALNPKNYTGFFSGLFNKIKGISFGGLRDKIKDAFTPSSTDGLFKGVKDRIKGLSEPLKGLKDKLMGAFSGAADKAKGIQFDPRMAGGGRFRDMASGRMVSEETANAAGVFKPGTGPAAAPAPKDNGQALKEKMQNIAEGIKAFADTNVIKGALSMIVAAPGLVALGLASLPLKITEKINGKAIEAAMKGIARGVAAFANPQVLLGGLALIPVSLALATMAVGAIGLGAIALLGIPAAAGMFALTAGLTALGTAAATGVPFLGVGLIAAFGAALIPFGIALATAAPAIEAVGNTIATVITSIADAVVTVMPSLTQSLIDLSNNINLGGLFGLAMALPALAIGLGSIVIMSPMIAFSALTLMGLGMALTPLVASADGLTVTADALVKVAEAIQLLDIGKIAALALSVAGLTVSLAGLMALGPVGLSALAVVGGIAAVGAGVGAAVGTAGGGGVGGGGAGVAAANAGGITGEEVRAIVEETVTATINALVPEMVSALRDGINNIQVTNNNFNNSRQSEGPSRNRNITNNNFA